MRKVIVTMWMSLDGYVSGPNDNMDFVGKFYDVLGRVTYDSFAGSWPKVPDSPDVSGQERQYARMLNAGHKEVYSKSMDESAESAGWEGTTVHKDIDPEQIKAWKRQDGKDMVVYGSTSIVQQQ